MTQFYDEDMGFTQFNVDRRRVELGLGSNACLSIVEQVCIAALNKPKEVMQMLQNHAAVRQITLGCVNKWDLRSDTGACDPQDYLTAGLRAAGCTHLWHQIVILRIPDPLQFAHILCAHPHPFVIAVTAQPCTTSLRANDVSNTFAVVAAGGEFALHDSHVGRTIVVHDCHMQAAQFLVTRVYDSLLPAMNCSKEQLELLICDMGVQLSNQLVSDMLSTLCSRPGCNPAFLNAFVQVGRQILAKWSCFPHECGDIACASFEYHRLKAKCRSMQHSMPQWFLGSLFFYLHSWRFSYCMHEFVTGCLNDITLWCDQDESALELAMQKSLPGLCKVTDAVFQSAYRMNDDRFIIEKAFVPEDVVSYCAGYKFGPSGWLHQHFPFVMVGQLVSQVLGDPEHVDSNFSNICQQLHDVFSPSTSNGRPRVDQGEGEQQHNFSFFMAHKLRAYLTTEGMAGKSVGFCESVSELSTNSAMRTSLGSPSPEECMFIFGCRIPPLDCGFHIGLVGQVLKASLDNDGAVDASELRTLVNDLHTLSPDATIAGIFSGFEDDPDENLISWRELTWHSPLNKLRLVQSSRQNRVGKSEQQHAGQAGSYIFAST